MFNCSLSGFPCSSTPPTSRLTSRRQDLRSPSWSCRWVAQLNIASNIKSSAWNIASFNIIWVLNIASSPIFVNFLLIIISGSFLIAISKPWWNSEEFFLPMCPSLKAISLLVRPRERCWEAKNVSAAARREILRSTISATVELQDWKRKIQPALQLLKGSEWAIHKCKREQNTAEI